MASFDGNEQGPAIEILGRRAHAKASERYLDVRFRYSIGAEWHGAVPVEYRRTGIDARTEEEERALVAAAYAAMKPTGLAEWVKVEEKYWDEEKSRAVKTRPFFNALLDFKWKCRACDLPDNANYARRIQDIKELGYTVATSRLLCKRCEQQVNHHQLLALPRGDRTGYEAWSPKLRKRILRVLRNYDAYEDTNHSKHLLPDHKFPEIRWDSDTRDPSLESLTDAEIEAKFQLVSNQRNQQKREACRGCYQSGVRSYPHGIQFYYAGTQKWPADVPRRGNESEVGCVGCGWYDLSAWRRALNKLLAGPTG